MPPRILKFSRKIKSQFREPPIDPVSSDALSKEERILLMRSRHPRHSLWHPLDIIHSTDVARMGTPNCRNGRCWEGAGELVPEEPKEDPTEIETLEDEIKADLEACLATRWAGRREGRVAA